jgi:hypothetical protein
MMFEWLINWLRLKPKVEVGFSVSNKLYPISEPAKKPAVKKPAAKKPAAKKPAAKKPAVKKVKK